MTTSDTYSDGTDSQTVVSSDYSTLSCVSNDFSGDYNQTTTDSSSSTVHESGNRGNSYSLSSTYSSSSSATQGRKFLQRRLSGGQRQRATEPTPTEPEPTARATALIFPRPRPPAAPRRPPAITSTAATRLTRLAAKPWPPPKMTPALRPPSASRKQIPPVRISRRAATASRAAIRPSITKLIQRPSMSPGPTPRGLTPLRKEPATAPPSPPRVTPSPMTPPSPPTAIRNIASTNTTP